jgi:hypothetical protein
MAFRHDSYRSTSMGSGVAANEWAFTYQEAEFQKIVQGMGANDAETLSARKSLFRSTASMVPSNT